MTIDRRYSSTIDKLNLAIKTLNLDTLADEGILFTNIFCCDQTCTPGSPPISIRNHPSKHSAWSLGTRVNPKENIFLIRCLKQAGYRTLFIKKAHFEPRNTDL